jgi:hypothetical protein
MCRYARWLAIIALTWAMRAWPQSPQADRDFWAYRPVQRVLVPEVRDAAWLRGDIDRFVLAPLEHSQRRVAPDSDRVSLLRRVYFDLIGLPPSIAQIDLFLADESHDALERVVDGLLDSPQFGERWGRHWLDVARYADSSGGGRSLLFPDAWRYRDYVIESFNGDKPFDQFIREQIAGDLLPADDDGERAQRLIATAFLMIGAHNYELQDKEQLRMDVVDEQIEAIGRAFLGQTLGCARCHDHKFDPIPTKDYYALAGILRSTKSLTPGNVSGFEQHELPVSAERRAALDAYAAAVKALTEQLDAAKLALKNAKAESKVAGDSSSGSRAARLGIVVDDANAKTVGNWTKSKYNSGYIGDGYIHDGASGKGEKSVSFHVDLPHDGIYEVRLSYTHGSNRSPSVPITVHYEGDQETIQVDQRHAPPIDGQFVRLGRWRFARGGSDVVISNEGTTGHVIVDAVQFIPAELLDAGANRDETRLGGGDTQAANRDTAPHADREGAASALTALESQVKRLEGDMKKLKEGAPVPAPLTMGVKDEKDPGEFFVCVRGDVHSRGQDVRRGFLSLASSLESAPTTIASHESGRRELAEWIASPANPLTARVAVNRIWHHLFGCGLVRTTDNFGNTGEAPSHPELLDWLAHRFVELGWSQKKLIREIVLSHVYRLATNSREQDGDVADPANRMLARQNRKRLDAECLRDAMLVVAGSLDESRGGPAIDAKLESEYGYKFQSLRRSVYSPIFRNNLPDIFDVFDFADPNTPTGQRNVSTLPSQALFLMNSPFVRDAARHAAENAIELDMDETARVERAFRQTLSRRPTETEQRIATEYLQHFHDRTAEDPKAVRRLAWSRLYQALMGSVEFRYLN